jgi:hypothetical protein
VGGDHNATWMNRFTIRDVADPANLYYEVRP